MKHDETAKKVIVVAHCLAQMRQQSYKMVLMLNEAGDIIHGNCGCPAGSGPTCTCKHVAALCYALEDFVKTFVLPEDIPSCTGMYNICCHAALQTVMGYNYRIIKTNNLNFHINTTIRSKATSMLNKMCTRNTNAPAAAMTSVTLTLNPLT